MTKQILAIDPGESTGWSVLADPGGHEIAHGVFTYEEAPSWIDNYYGLFGPTVTVVIEDFSLFMHKALQQSGSKFKTVRVIGMFELWAHQLNVPVVYQSPQIKVVAEKFTGRKPVGAHRKSHDIDAYNHGAYYLHHYGRYNLPKL